MQDQNFSMQTKAKSKTKLIVSLIIGVIALVGIGGGILYFSGVWERGTHNIDLSRAFKVPVQEKSDPYMVYKSEKGEEGLRLDTEEFVNQIDTPNKNPFENPQGIFSNCEAMKSLGNAESLGGLVIADFSNIFISSSDDPQKEDKIADPITINFTDLSKNKIYPKVKMRLTGKFFEEVVKKMVENNQKLSPEELKNAIENRLKDSNLSEQEKKILVAYLLIGGSQIPSDLTAESDEFKKLQAEGFTFYLSFNDLQTNHLTELRFQYDPRYMIVRNGEIFPLAPTGDAGVSLKAKLCDGIESLEIKVTIPQKDFQNFKPEKTGDITSKETNFGAYDSSFLIGKTQSQQILKEEIDKISKPIIKASLKVKTLHHIVADGKMEIYLSPDGGETWIAPNEEEPKINHPKNTDEDRDKYISQENTFTYDFKRELQPQDLRMIVVAQNKSITGGDLSVQDWAGALSQTKGKLLEKKNPNVAIDSGFVDQKTFFITQGKDAEIKVKDSKGTPLSSFEMVSKFDAGMKQADNKIDATAAKPFYTQLLFKEESIIIPNFSNLKLDASKTDFENSANIVLSLRTTIIDLKNETQKVPEGIKSNDIVDPAEIQQKISQLDQVSGLLKQAWPKNPANLVSQKSQVEQLNTYVNELKNDFNVRKTLDNTTLDKLKQIENTLNTLDDALKTASKTSWLEKNNLALFKNYFVKEAKAATGITGTIGTIGDFLPSPTVFSAVVLPYSTPILNAAEIYFETEEKPTVTPASSPAAESLDINPISWYRGHSRVVLKWNFTSGATNNIDPSTISFKYGEAENAINKGAIVYKDKNDNRYVVVLKGLKGGEYSDKNDQGFQEGRFPYFYKVTVGDKSTPIKSFKTLNRMQTICYYYTLVLDRDYCKDQSEENLAKWKTPDSVFTGKAVKDLENGGPGFHYKPQGKEPLTLLGIKFTMVNDRMAKEFDNKLLETQKNKGMKEATIRLYRIIHDRIYTPTDEEYKNGNHYIDLGKFYDDNGANFWTAMTDKKQIKKYYKEKGKQDVIDIFGVKFALSVSKEYQDELFSGLGSAAAARPELAYQIVLKRGADKEGLDYLKKSFPTAKEMRKHLAESDEYSSRIKSIDKEFGRAAAISEMYETLYGRASDIKGVNYWDKSKLSFDILKQKFISSNEFTKVIKE